MNPMAMPQGMDPLAALAALASGQGAQQAQAAPMGAEAAVDSPLARALAYAQQQQAQMGPAPQADPSAMSDMAAAQRQQELAAALMGSEYVPNSGALGALAQTFSAYKGGKMDRKAGETIADALKRQTEQQQAQAQYAAKVKAFEEGPGKILTMAERAQATGYEPTAAELASGEFRKEATPKGFQASGGFLVNKDTGETQAIPGYMDARTRIAAAGRSGSGAGGQGKAPSGYRWDEEGNLAAIPGGPADKPEPGTKAATLPAETRMKLGMLTAAREAAKKYEQAVFPEGGGFNREQLWVGPAGGQIEEAINNVLRVESGAAVPESEVEGGVRRYGATTFNREATARANLQQLYDKIDIIERSITGGEPAAPDAAPAPAPIQAGQDLGGGIKVRSVRPAGQ